MGRRTRGDRRRLQIHRETVRRLSSTELGEVVGGTVYGRIMGSSACALGSDPKTGVWTGGDGGAAGCTA